jgi:ribosomal protein S18 acetylase RimI-like enzyme
MKIRPLSGPEVLRRREELSALLRDAVRHGASVGFLRAPAEAELQDYWRGVAGQVTGGTKRLFAAEDGRGRLLGSAQLALESKANGAHRAEVQKVMVFARARGRGIGAALMARLEQEARVRGRTLLTLDTSIGTGGAVRFYRRLGYRQVGGIPRYAADPDGRLVKNAIFYKLLRPALS